MKSNGNDDRDGCDDKCAHLSGRDPVSTIGAKSVMQRNGVTPVPSDIDAVYEELRERGETAASPARPASIRSTAPRSLMGRRHAASHAPRWAIPSIGVLRPSIDRVVIVSTMSVGALKKRLPIAAIERASHKLNFTTYQGPHPGLRSIISLTGTGSTDPWLILAAQEQSLGGYSIMTVELAFDVPVASNEAAREGLFALVGTLSKAWHRRGHLRCVHRPDEIPPAGQVSEPTYYYEDPGSGVKMKCYIRHEKLVDGAFGDLVVRLEWTLARKPALTRHLGGNQISHLLAADLNAFLDRNIRLEQPDLAALGDLFRGLKITSSDSPRGLPQTPGQWNDPAYRPVRAALLILRIVAYREWEQGKFADWAQAIWTCQNSPAQIRGYCRELRDGDRPPRRGRPRMHQPRPMRRPITDYRIDACFHKIDLIEVPRPVQ